MKRPVAVRHKDHGSRHQQSTHPGPCAESLPHQHHAAEAGQHRTHRFQREGSAGAQASQGGEIEAVTGGDAHAAAEQQHGDGCGVVLPWQQRQHRQKQQSRQSVLQGIELQGGALI